MMQIAGYFWQMCLLRAGPEVLPSSNFVLGFVLSLYLPVAFGVSLLARPGEGVMVTFAVVLIGISLQALVTLLLATYKGHPGRFKVTWAALLGTNAFMLIVLLPISLVIVNSDGGALKFLADSAWWACFGWWLAIAGHIYHRAVDVSILQGSAITFLTEMLSVTISVNLLSG